MILAFCAGVLIGAAFGWAMCALISCGGDG